MRQHVNIHRLFSLTMLVSCFISLVAFSFFMVPLVSILREFHCAWKEIYVNPHTLFLHTSCESRTVSWNDTSSAMYKNSVKRVNFVSWIDGGKKLPVPATVRSVIVVQGTYKEYYILLSFANYTTYYYKTWPLEKKLPLSN